MPLIDFSDANAGSDLLPGQLPETVAHPQLAVPDWLDTSAAALRQNNIVSSAYDRLERIQSGENQNPDAVPGYDPFNDISGFEEHADRFIRSQSPAETQLIKNRITSELADRDTLRRAGGWGLTASIAAGTVDPVTLATMAIPVAPAIGVASRAARIGAGVAANAALTAGQEALLHQNQELRTAGDSALNIGAGALLTSLFGAWATRVPRAVFNESKATLQASLNGGPDTLSAARVADTTIGQETIARGGETIAKTVGRISPLNRIMTGVSLEARRIIQQIVDVPYLLAKNFEGVATPTSVELRVKQAAAQRGHTLATTLDSAFADYKAGGGTLSHSEFGEQVAAAMRRGDVHDIPQVQTVAREARAVFEADKAALQKAGALPEEIETLGAKSYFPRVYDQHAIAANRVDFEDRLTRWFAEHPKLDANGAEIAREPAEVRAAVLDTLDKIQGTVRGAVDFGGVKNPSALKSRVLDVPDEILEPYLSSDFEHVMHSYNRTVLPQVEMRNTFGSVTLESEIQKITDEMHRQIELAATSEAKEQVRQGYAAVLRDFAALRDRVLGQVGPRGNESLAMVRAVRIAKSFNYVRLLGSQTLSSLSDYGRLVARYGLLRTAKTTAQFLASIPANRLIREDAKRMGTALEWTLDTRAQSLADIGDELAGSRLEKLVHKTTATFTRVSLMATWDSSMKAMASALEQEAIIRTLRKQRLTPFERARLAQAGIGEAELPAVRAQVALHASDEEGLARARTELWSDQNAARLVERAVIKAGDTVAFAVGKGDLPLMMNKELWRTLLQFRSFGMATVSRLMIPVSQGLARGDVASANGMAVMLALGGLTYASKEWAAGRTPDLEADRLVPEMLNWSGVLGYIPDVWDLPAGAFHLPRFSNFKERSPSESLAGPTAGTVDTVYNTIHGITDGKISAKDVHKLRQLIPFQNLFYLRRIINAVEGETSEAIGAEGADRKDFVSRVTDTAPVDKTK